MRNALKLQLNTVYFRGLMPRSVTRRGDINLDPLRLRIEVDLNVSLGTDRRVAFHSNRHSTFLSISEEVFNIDGKDRKIPIIRVYQYTGNVPAPVCTEKHSEYVDLIVKELYENLGLKSA